MFTLAKTPPPRGKGKGLSKVSSWGGCPPCALGEASTVRLLFYSNTPKNTIGAAWYVRYTRTRKVRFRFCSAAHGEDTLRHAYINDAAPQRAVQPFHMASHKDKKMGHAVRKSYSSTNRAVEFRAEAKLLL